MTDEIDAFLDFCPPPIVRQVAVLRGLMQSAAPDAIERLRPGWRLIGYDLPISRHGTVRTREIIRPGGWERLEFRTPEVGHYEFVCTIHEGMAGTLVVR